MNFKIAKLIPEHIQKAFKKQGYTGDKSMSEIKIICKLFNPTGVGTFWLYEHVEEDVYMAFCLLQDPTDAEIGSISLKEIVSVQLPYGLDIERDLHFPIGEITLAEVFKQIKKR